jgi:excisionase family DNA binding protein
MHQNDPAFSTTSDVARELRVSEAYVRKLANSGRLHAIRTQNGIRLFDRDEVARFQAQRAAAAVA